MKLPYNKLQEISLSNSCLEINGIKNIAEALVENRMVFNFSKISYIFLMIHLHIFS